MTTIQGLAYPLQVESGRLKLSSDFDIIRQSIMSVLETRPYERIMRPLYGTPDLVFDVVSDVSIIAERVRIALITQIPDVVFTVSGKVDDGGLVLLSVGWALNAIPQPPIQYQLS